MGQLQPHKLTDCEYIRNVILWHNYPTLAKS